jgi:type VI secretion system protein ImpC
VSTAGESGKQAAPAAAAAEGSLLDQITNMMPRAVEKPRRDELIRSLVEESLKGTVHFDKNVTKTITRAIAAIDDTLSKQLAAIMHNADFQKLEGSWRGLHHLVMNSETGAQLKLRVFNVSKRELFKDLDKAVEFDQSQAFKKIYEAEFGSPGGEPYGALIGDYEFSNHPEDVDLLAKMSQVSAAGFCPFISAASPKLIGMESFTELSKPRDLEKIFLDETYVKWRSFRDSDDSRFVVLTMPRSLSRLPYGKNTKVVEEFDFEEVELDAKGDAKPVPHENYAWMNTSYVLGAKLTDAFAKFGWCTAIRGAENGGKVEGLPAHVFTCDDGD